MPCQTGISVSFDVIKLGFEELEDYHTQTQHTRAHTHTYRHKHTRAREHTHTHTRARTHAHAHAQVTKGVPLFVSLDSNCHFDH